MPYDKKKKRKPRKISARTKAVGKKAKEMKRRVKRGTAGTAKAGGGGVGKASGGQYSGSMTAKRQASKKPAYGGGKKGSGGNLYRSQGKKK